MTRARFVMGDSHMKARFDQVRHTVISAERDPILLKQEIVNMRNRVRSAHPVKAEYFDVKHSPGAMVDAEFAVQYLVLMHTRTHPDLADNVGNIALLQRFEAAGLLPQGVGSAASTAYRELRRVQHKARLNEEPTHVEGPVLKVEQDAIWALWRAVFPDEANLPNRA